MSELSSDTAETDLPGRQGLGDAHTAGAGLDGWATGSDPMPDLSGTSGTGQS